jgi:hypothetical protein
MKLIEYTPYVVNEVRKHIAIKETALTIAVFGSSGKGNPSLTKSLFPYCVRKGLIAMTLAGRSKIYTITEKGENYLNSEEGKKALSNWGL